MLLSLLRYVFAGRSRLGSFARSFVSQHFAHGTSRGTAPKRLFPMALPYPEVFRRGCRGEKEELARKKGVSAIVICLNFIQLNRPVKWPTNLALEKSLRKFQWEAIRRLERLLGAWIRVSPIGPSEMGRTSSKVESLEEVLSSLEGLSRGLAVDQSHYFGNQRGGKREEGSRLFGLPVVGGELQIDSFSTFKTVEPERLSFVGRPEFDPGPYLDPWGKKVFEDPLKRRLSPHEVREAPPKLKVHCSSKQRAALFKLLDDSGRLGVHLPNEVTPDFGSGLFSVVKDQHRDRLIMDSRGANLLETPAQRWIQTLACREALCKLLMEPEDTLKASGNDVRDFYHLFRSSSSRSRRNVLASAIHAKSIANLGAVKEKHLKQGMVFCSLATLAMGDSQAVELAQTCHVGLALDAETACEDTLLSLRKPIPRSRTMTGLVIDDFVTLSLVRREEGDGATEAARLADIMQEKNKEVKLIPHEQKAFRDQEEATFWGAEIDGAEGIIRGSLKRAVPLAGLILQMVKLGLSTADLLQTISGSLIALFLYRRRFLSLMDSLFGSYRGCKGREIVRMSGRLRDDLLIMVTLLPLAATNLKAQVAPRITATDASNWGEAAVTAAVPSQVANELYRHVLRKSVWVRLLRPSAAWMRSHGVLPAEEELPGEEECFRSNPLWQVLAEGLQYHLMYAKSARGRRHINIGELRAVLRAERLHGREAPSTREIFGVDSQVAIGTLVKGRSSSPSLNSELVRSLPDMLGYDSYSESIYFETHCNRADAPTRGRDIPGPSRSLPDWWRSLSAGLFEEFDAWMRRYEIHPDQLAELPPFSELLRGAKQKEAEAREFAKLFSKANEDVNSRSKEEEADVSTEAEIRRVSEAEAAFAEAEVADAEAERRSAEAERGSAEAEKEAESAERAEAEVSKAKRKDGAGSREELSIEIRERLGKFDASQVVFGSDKSWPPKSPGYLDLFSGERGVAVALAKLTNRWVICFDLEHSVLEDLGDRKLRRDLEFLVDAGAFLGLGGGPVCKSFSMAVTPAIRSAEHPYGKPDVSERMQKSLTEGNDLALWTFSMLRRGLKKEMAVWLENPSSSWMFRIPAWKKLGEDFPSLGFWVVDYCRYGASWRKRTKFASNTPLKGWKTLCVGGHVHQLLRGRSKVHGKSWTLVAQPYPAGVAIAVASGMALATKQIKWNRCFNPATCARCGDCRVGEASNPGPRKVRARGAASLEEIELVEPKTLVIQDKVWRSFLKWLTELISPGAARSAMACPELLALLLKEYGYHLYASGGSLFCYRHLVVFVQKNFPLFKLHLGGCWDTITKWELAEPTVHRVPVPFALVQAILSVGLLWEWRLFSCVVALSFFGISRPGEPLRGPGAAVR